MIDLLFLSAPGFKALLDGPNFAHLATLMPDGSPQSVPVWVGREKDYVLVCTGEGSLKAKNIRRDPRVVLSIIDFHDPTRKLSFVAEWSSAVLMAISGTWTLSYAAKVGRLSALLPLPKPLAHQGWRWARRPALPLAKASTSRLPSMATSSLRLLVSMPNITNPQRSRIALPPTHGKNDHAKGKEHSTQAQQHLQNARDSSKPAHEKSQQQK